MNIEVKIDELGALSSQVKEMEARIKMLKDEIVGACGEGKFRGAQFGVTVSLFNSNVVEYKKILEELQAPAELVQKHTKQNAVIRVTPTL